MDSAPDKQTEQDGLADGSQQEHRDYFPLLELPTELLMTLFEYLDSATVIKTLAKVCKYLADVVADDLIWKVRIHKRWPGKRYPAIAHNAQFDWKTACIKREEEYRRWKEPAKTLHRTNIMFNASVDAVHITKDSRLVVGLRDHTLLSMRLDNIPYSDTQPGGDLPEEAEQNADIPCLDTTYYKLKESHIFSNTVHKGWVWALNSDGDRLSSGGWDSKVMLWDESGIHLSTHGCKSAVLCTTMNGTEIIAGTFNKSLAVIDTRQSAPVSLMRVHKRAVLTLQTTPDFIIAGSETKVIYIFDKKCMQVCNTAHLETGYPRSMHLVGNTMYIGSSTGMMYLYEFDERMGSLTFKETLPDNHTQEVRSIRQSLGSVISASKDGVCQVWEPSGNPGIITSLNIGAEISAMDYRDDYLALGVAPGSVCLYRSQ